MLCQYDFPSPYFDDISDMAKELINNLLVKDPQKRLTADQILDHTWMQGIVTPRTYLPNVTLHIKEFNSRRKFKRATYMVMAAQRFQNILKHK
jgi:calcium/calmodulin-dependent protein kinase-4